MDYRTINNEPLTLTEKTNKFLASEPNSVAAQNMLFFQCKSLGCEYGLRLMINGLETYCRGVLVETSGETLAGSDYYIAPLLEDIARGLRGLLSSYGKFDGGTIDSTILEICSQHKLDIE